MVASILPADTILMLALSSSRQTGQFFLSTRVNILILLPICVDSYTFSKRIFVNLCTSLTQNVYKLGFRSIGPEMFEGEALGLSAMYETNSIRVPKPFKVEIHLLFFLKCQIAS